MQDQDWQQQERGNMARRKSAGERRPEKAGKPNQYWEKFRSILHATENRCDALALALAMPRQETPGRKFHTNLLWFLQDFTVPNESNLEERSLYLELIRRFDAAGELKPGMKCQVEKALQAHFAGAH